MMKRGWLLVLAVFLCGWVCADDKVPTDYKAGYMTLDQLEKQLKDNGLEVVGKHAVSGNTNYTTVVYTSAALKELARKPQRGFIGVLRILHNAEGQEIVASNPEYFIRAFFQKEYKEGMGKPVKEALASALGTLTPTEDLLKAKKLAKYNFMMGMPHYDDFVRVAKGSTPELLNKLEANARERMVFKMDLNGDGSAYLCGIALSPEIEKFNEKLETMGQSHLLPYVVLIQDGEANILHAKYYLALSFPRLTMGEFMKIRAVPGDIKDSFEADFQ